MAWTRREVGIGLIAVGGAGASSSQGQALRGQRFGVQTHFAQGASPRLLQELASAGVYFDFVRDEIYWQKLESRRIGEYDWGYCDGYVDAVSRSGRKILLAVEWSNPLYHALQPAPAARHPRNGILMPETPAERDGFVRYVMAVLGRYANPRSPNYRRGLFEGVEVWNEANGSWTGDIPVRQGPGGVPATLVALTAAVYRAIRSDHAYDSIPVLGGACIKIPVNFIKWMLQAGLGEVIDGLAVHPYMPPEDILVSAQGARQLLDQAGLSRVSLWATEFGNSKTPGLLLKTLAAISASPFQGSSYYLAQSAHPAESGLLDLNGGLTPVGRSYQAWAPEFARLRFMGRLPSQPKTYLLQFGRPGEPPLVVAWCKWGQTVLNAPRGSSAFDAFRRPVPGPEIALGQEPVVIIGSGSIRESVQEGRPVSDSFADFSISGAQRNWSYFYRVGDEQVRPLDVCSDQYEDFFGLVAAGPARMDAQIAHPGRLDGQPLAVVRRYTASRPMSLAVSGRVARPGVGGDGSGVSVVTGDGRPLLPRMILRDPTPMSFSGDVNLQPGQSIDLVTDPGDRGDLDFDAVSWDCTLYEV